MTASVRNVFFLSRALDSVGGSIYVNLANSGAVWHIRGMNISVPTNLYKNYRFPAEIISHGVWLYFRFCLSYRITDQLKSSGAAKREVLPSFEHRQHRYLNNRAENSHQSTRQREQHMQRFRSRGHAQRFLAAYSPLASHFRGEVGGNGAVLLVDCGGQRADSTVEGAGGKA